MTLVWSDLESFPGQKTISVTPRNDRLAILFCHPNSSENSAHFFLHWYSLDALSKVETGIIAKPNWDTVPSLYSLQIGFSCMDLKLE